MNQELLKFIAAGVLATGLVAAHAPAAHAGARRLFPAASTSGDDPVATDCPLLLRAAVGTQTCSANPCICRRRAAATDKGDGRPGLPADLGGLSRSLLDCPAACPTSSRRTIRVRSVHGHTAERCRHSAGIAARSMSTDYLGAFSQDQDPVRRRLDPGLDGQVHGNNKVWHPATAGTLNGATPAATGSCPAGTTSTSATTCRRRKTGCPMDLWRTGRVRAASLRDGQRSR